MLSSINDYFEEITSYEGDLFAVIEVLKFFENGIDFNKIRSNDFLLGTRSTFRDPSLTKEGVDLFLTGYKYIINEENFTNSLTRLESRESLFVFSQIYESFETYLKAILINFFDNNPTYLKEASIFESLKGESRNTRSFINKLQNKDRNNKKLLWTLRKLSSHYSEFETKNNLNFSYSIWFDLISDTRHCVVHNRQVATRPFINSLTQNRKEAIFNRYFELENIGSKTIIKTDHSRTRKLIDEWNEYAYFIYKSLTLELELELNFTPVS